MIKEILDNDEVQVTIITRPRRFGKTLNLSMLHYFLTAEIDGIPTQGLFDNLKIASAGSTYMEHQGKYPVISLTFKCGIVNPVEELEGSKNGLCDFFEAIDERDG